MKDIILKIKESRVAKVTKSFLASKYYPFVTAAVTLICYYLSLDIITVLYIGITGGLIALLCDDLTPMLSPFLFVSVFISFKNSPSSVRGNSDYYLRVENLVPIIMCITFWSLSLIYRLITTILKRKFTLSPIFYGLCVLSAVLFFNGVIYKGFDLMNLMFGAFMLLSFLFVFALFRDNIIFNDKTYERISVHFLAFSLLLVIELIEVYITTENLFVNGIIQRTLIRFGWGVYTGYGLYIAMCLPAIIYLAGRYRYGFVLTFYSVVVLVATIMCCSRQAMLAAAIVYPISFIVLLVKGKNRIANLCVAGAALVAGIILFGIFFDKATEFFKTIFANVFINGELNGSGRIDLWRQAIADFKKSPIFGIGFNANLMPDNVPALGFSFLPNMYHNTILQMLASCGLVGLAAYLFHRAQTIKSFLNNITVERICIALIATVILIESLLDHHIFSITPTIVYSILIAVLDKTSLKQNVLFIKYDCK